jgi:hypothetical protein
MFSSDDESLSVAGKKRRRGTSKQISCA